MKIEKWSNKYDRYLQDESRHKGNADFICFPENTADVSEAIKWAGENSMTVTVQGANTGLAGASIPHGGLVLNTCKMNRIFGIESGNLLHVQCGVTLKMIHDYTSRHMPDSYFVPDPTEDSATIGGMFGTNAGGMSSACTGKCSEWINAIEWVDASGEVHELNRGTVVFRNNQLTIGEKQVKYTPPDHESAAVSKLIPHEGMDYIDFLSGYEGHLGIVTRLKVSLKIRPKYIWGVMYFMKSGRQCLDYMNILMERRQKSCNSLMQVFEYYDNGALCLLKEGQKTHAGLKTLARLPEQAENAIYIELAGDEAGEIEEELYEQIEQFIICGGNESDTWAGDDASEINRMRQIRHAVMELANEKSDACRLKVPELRKLYTDFEPGETYSLEYIRMYQSDIADMELEAAIAGHVINGRMHIEFFPHSLDDEQRIQKLIRKWAGRILQDNGQLISESGIGIARRSLINTCLDAAALKYINRAGKVLDPDCRLKGRTIV